MADAAAPPDIRDTFGILVLGTILGSLCEGIYFGKHETDRFRTSALVVALCIMDTMTWFLELYTTWFYFVINYANPAALAEPFWALKLEPGFTYTVALLAQLFFVEKIYFLTERNSVITISLGILALAAWGYYKALGLTLTGIVFHVDSLVSVSINVSLSLSFSMIWDFATLTPYQRVNIAQKTLSTLLEVLIAGFMCYLFKTRQTGMRRTDNMLNRLILFAASRGLIMSIVQVLYTITFFVYNDKLIWVVFHFMLSKLCSNSVLASLNIRGIVRGDDAGTYTGSNNIGLRPTCASHTTLDFAKPDSTHIVLTRDTQKGDTSTGSYVTEGSIGIVTCTWMTQEEQNTCTLERNARAYDISDPIGAFNFATFLCMLAHVHVPRLRQALDKLKDKFLEDFSENMKTIRWTMEHQRQGLKDIPTEESKL
ncbi:hypothetical protein EW146_g8714 [Bondarzewia mesenterica]|uniref:DUF6534 domain-containing protein n=1 Tax=Bondarzewia mesenterica TaxID=1095465 RepID=A0A4S4LE04_9AGAM|nr:hypothetical protein EW146_g8714 [Bondarzewia mesenterica]